jgi:four helix bundle protein
MKFGFRELEVWRKAITFANRVISITENLESDRKHFRLVENLEAAVASIAANIAEGAGRLSKKEFTQFLYIARGSLYEVVTFLEIFKDKKWISDTEHNRLLEDAEEIVRMLSGLIKSLQK